MAEDAEQKKKLEELQKLRAQNVANEPTWDTASSTSLEPINLDKWQETVGDNWASIEGKPGTSEPIAAPTMNWGHSSGTTAGTDAARQDAREKQSTTLSPTAGIHRWTQDTRERQSTTLNLTQEAQANGSQAVISAYEGIGDTEESASGQRAKKMQTPEEARRQAELEAQRARQKNQYENALALMKTGDQKSALRQLKELASDGCPDAQFKLGVLYQKGEGLPQDYKVAALWFEKAALQDHPKAQYNLGLMYKDGVGVEADYRRTIMWWELSARQGHANSQFNLVAICKQYAEKGDASAMYKLARMYFRGVGVEACKETAFKWFLLSARQDYPPAPYWVGLCFENGWGCDMDMNRAVRAYDHAFRLGLVEAGAKIKSSQAQQILREHRATGTGPTGGHGSIQLGGKPSSPWKPKPE